MQYLWFWQLWILQGKICLVFDICCWYLLSWFWCDYCSWISKLVDFTGYWLIEFLVGKFVTQTSVCSFLFNFSFFSVVFVNSIVVFIEFVCLFLSPLQIFSMQLLWLVAHLLLKVQLNAFSFKDDWGIIFYFFLSHALALKLWIHSSGASLLVAIQAVKKGAAAEGMKLRDYIWRGHDPTSVAVMTEVIPWVAVPLFP